MSYNCSALIFLEGEFPLFFIKTNIDKRKKICYNKLFNQKETYNITAAVLNGLEKSFNIEIEDKAFTEELRSEIGEAFNWCGPSEFQEYLSDFIYNIDQIENLNEDELFSKYADYFNNLNDLIREYLLKNTKHKNGILL